MSRHSQSDLRFPLRDFAVHRQLDRPDFAVKIQRLIEDDNGKLLLRAKMLDDRGDVVVRRIDLFGDVNHFTGELPLAVFE